MLFTSTVFLLFFLPLLLILYFLMPGGRNGKHLGGKNLILLLFSLIVYGWGGVSYLGLMLVSIVVNYTGGLLCGIPKSDKVRKASLIITMIVNLGLLGWFKYAGFAATAVNSLGIAIPIPEVVLPIGISFFTFQSASYVIDVYRRDAAVQKNPLNVALYVSLFPQLVAGPIVRYTTVENEIGTRVHTMSDFTAGLTRFMFGFGKKMILANTMGEIADKVFALDAGTGLTTPVAWVGAIAYTFQIYFDFSAYSDMAIGLGRMFGFRFLENFNYPYIANSVTDFWRRWHISLSTWFRDYVYIPLGGNRCSKGRHIFNLMVVWSLTGLWHGANWTFIVWGMYFGVLLILEKYVFAKVMEKIPVAIRHIITLLIVIISWVLFRANTISDAVNYIGTMFGMGGNFGADRAVFFLRQYLFEFIVGIIAIFPVKRVAEGFFEKHKDNHVVNLLGEVLPKGAAFAVFYFGYIKLISGSFNPFIYFQF